VSKHACPTLLLSALWKNLSDRVWIFGIIFFLVGGFLCFFGNKYKPVSFFFSGFITGCGGCIVALGEFAIESDTDYKIVVVGIIISVLFGILFGFLTTKV